MNTLSALPRLAAALLAANVAIAAVHAQTLRSPHASLDSSLTKDAVHAIRIGVAWLEAQQQETGCWSSPEYPASTALAVSAILRSPGAIAAGACPASASRGLAFILSCVQEDGCIYVSGPGAQGGGLPNYNTALCLMALDDAGDPAYRPAIDAARRCLIEAQYLGPGIYRGGMGYDARNERMYADLSNTVFALEALRRTRPRLPDQPEEEAVQLDWDAAVEFVSRCQHLRAGNPAAWVSETTAERGGFVYHPERSQAGAAESGDADGEYLRSYGSMTYAGLLSFIYAEVDRDDPRVQAAVDWLARHWSLEENPRMGEQGLYYYYHTMAKALNALGEERLRLADGGEVEWRPALVRKLISLQRIDPATGYGYWMNDNNRWWESDPNLATSYTLLALETALFGVAPAADRP